MLMIGHVFITPLFLGALFEKSAAPGPSGDASVVRSRRPFRCSRTSVGRSRDVIERLLSGRLAASSPNFSESKRSVSIQLWHQSVLGERLVVSAFVAADTYCRSLAQPGAAKELLGLGHWRDYPDCLADRAKTNRASPLAKIAVGFVSLDYSAEVIQHADLCRVRTRERSVLRVRDRVTDRVWPSIPDRAVSKPIAD